MSGLLRLGASLLRNGGRESYVFSFLSAKKKNKTQGAWLSSRFGCIISYYHHFSLFPCLRLVTRQLWRLKKRLGVTWADETESISGASDGESHPPIHRFGKKDVLVDVRLHLIASNLGADVVWILVLSLARNIDYCYCYFFLGVDRRITNCGWRLNVILRSKFFLFFFLSFTSFFKEGLIAVFYY